MQTPHSRLQFLMSEVPLYTLTRRFPANNYQITALSCCILIPCRRVPRVYVQRLRNSEF